MAIGGVFTFFEAERGTDRPVVFGASSVALGDRGTASSAEDAALMQVAMAPASVKIFAGVIISPPSPEESLGKTPELMIATIL